MKKVYEEATLEFMEVAKRDIIITSIGGSLDDSTGGNDSGGNSGGTTGGDNSGGTTGGGTVGGGGSSTGGGFDLPMDGF